MKIRCISPYLAWLFVTVIIDLEGLDIRSFRYSFFIWGIWNLALQRWLGVI
jgi:hypothetical protein